MAEIIEDGAGTGNKVQVDSENRLRTFSIVEGEEKHVNRDGRQWSLHYTSTPVGVGSVFFSIQNTGSVALAITDFRTMCAATETVEMEFATGTPVFTIGKTVDPVPKNAGSNRTPDAIITSDTTTTGLTGRGLLYFQRLSTADEMFKLATSANIIITPGATFTMKSTTGTALITGVVSIVELD